MVNKGKVGKRTVSTAGKSARKAAIDHAATPQWSDAHTPSELSRHLRPSSHAQAIDPPPRQLAGDALDATPANTSYDLCGQGGAQMMPDRP